MTEDEYDNQLYIPDGMEVPAELLQSLGVTSVKELSLRLKRSLYGLKQAGRLWHQLLRKTLLELNFVECITDTCIFYKADTGGTTVIGTYVDDLLVTAARSDRVDEFFAEMQVLELKDLGEADKFLGMQVEPDGVGYALNQANMIAEMLTSFGLENANAVRSPIGEEEPNLEGEVSLPVTSSGRDGLPSIREFQSLVGSLLWVARCTRPDIGFAVHRATRQCHAPTLQDWRLAKRIVRYLIGTRDLKLHLRSDDGIMIPVRISCYTDADFAGDRKDRKSVSAAVTIINGATIGWHCKKQSVVAVSTAEEDFVAAAAGGQEALGLKELFSELGLQVKTPIVLAMDNQAAMKQIENEAISESAKHVDVKLKFLRDYATKGVIKPSFVRSHDMLADLLTKALPAPRVLELRLKVGLK